MVLGVSGGWDSLALVVLVSAYASSVRPACRVMGIHVALDAAGVTNGAPAETSAFCAVHGVRLETVEPRFDPGEQPPGGCFACARVRRRTLLETANARGARFVALGHHADDVVETALLNLLYAGEFEAPPPRRSYFGGAVTIVRPLYELRKSELHRLARHCGFPPPPPACPAERSSRRDRVRGALASLGSDQRTVRRTLFWAAVRRLEGETFAEDRPCGTVETDELHERR